MNCDETRHSLPEYLSESLNEAQELAFASHLAACDACRAETERLGTLWRGLALLPGTMPEPTAQVRDRFYESLAAFKHGMESAPKHGFREKLAALWPRQPAWQMAIGFAMLVMGVGVGYEIRPAKQEIQQPVSSDVAQLRGEVSNMRQMVALSLMQQQSAGERLRGVSWAYRVESSDTEVLSALLFTVNNDASVGVRMAAVEALHAFGASPVTRTAIVQSIPKQTSPLVQVALIDLLVDLKVTDASSALKQLSLDPTVDVSVRESEIRAREAGPMKPAIVALILAAGLYAADEKTTEHKAFSGVRELVIDNISGFIEVSASTSGSVEMDIEKTLGGSSADRIALAKKEISLDTTQEGGLVRLVVDGPFRRYSNWHDVYKFNYDFKVRVPRDVKLELRTVNNSHITVEGTTGDYTISNVNGPIEMKNIEGSGTIHTVNGGVKVIYARNPAGATSFKSVNGSLDISFRSGLNADVKMKTMNGGLFTDFDVSATPVAATAAENRNGKFVWSSRRMTGVRIGQGGPELQFETLNGNVMIKNREK